ncbi:hypothetical protein EB796_003932 [Bugula neritina]|uniref:Integrase catalytic domain-containing protein n=1 Tax=Bugula neritina TaxID=10212 RepID=A0A7J7KGG2_BUGNE|nr:hypothetical protein EB796_003932 [Bugula neritina]
MWQIDLTDLQQFSSENNGFKYILLSIDTFSRKAYGVPLKTKSGLEVSRAMREIIENENNNTPPEMILSDRGKEFFNPQFKALMKEYNINHFSSNNQEIKASMVERLQRTLKAKLFKYFTHQNSHRYLDILNDLISSYNNSKHSAHNSTPNDVTVNNQEEIWHRLYTDSQSGQTNKLKYNVGDLVRISKYSTVFKKGYLPSWSEEIFTIAKIHTTNPPVYSLADDSGDQLEGTWYEPELQKVNTKSNTYKIESIVGQRTVNGKKQFLVRWAGYPPSFDSYVDKRDVIFNYKN